MKFPCEQCLTLGVCLGILSTKYVYKDNAYSLICAYLINKPTRCSLLKDYIRPWDHFDYNLKHREITRDFFVEKLGQDMP